MNEFFTLIFNIFILAIIGCIIENLSPNEKILLLIKPAISIIIMLTIINFVSNIKFENEIGFDFGKFQIDSEQVWQAQAENCEKILEKEIIKDCQDNNLNITFVDVDVTYDNDSFKINKVNIGGVDKISAKNYISGKYRIGLAYISTNED